MLGGAGNMSCKVRELYLPDACRSKFNLINYDEALSLNSDMESTFTL